MKVFIRAGHGGSDSGATSPSKIGGQTKHFYEKNVNLSVALACRDYLKAYNCEIIMARETDKKLVVEETVKQAQALGCDVFLEIHHNAANGQGRGCEIWYWHTDTKAKQLAEITLDELVKLGVKSRGLKPSSNESKSFKVCRMNNKKIPAILGEFCFLDNATDQKLIDTPQQLQAQGEAYGKAVVRFLGLKLKQTPTTPVKPSTGLKFKAGDIVQFAGGYHYKSASDVTGSSVKAGRAKITRTAPRGKHPYHLRAIDDKGAYTSGVYGWVDAASVTDAAAAPAQFKPVELPPTPTPEKEWVPKIGDVVSYTGRIHYKTAYALFPFFCRPGLARITNIHQLGKSKHPYHLQAVKGGKSTVFGWVNEGSFMKL